MKYLISSLILTFLFSLSLHAQTTHNGHAYVDLGLSVKWATCNVGATRPEGYGDYFAWGETKPKSSYTSKNYKYISEWGYSKYGEDNKTTLDPEDDVAHVNWGGSWRMPTDAELTELRTKCTWTWTTQNGVSGYKVTSKTNGNFIFLPTAGYRKESSSYHVGCGGYYLASSSCVRLQFSSGYVHRYCINGCEEGLSVRPVLMDNHEAKQNINSDGTSINILSKNHNDSRAVDLGLSVKWASCNVGATKPEEYGDYFAWGETTPKDSYTWENLKYSNGSTPIGPFTKYVASSKFGTVDNKTTLDPEDDAAHVNWGGSWRMPTLAELDELQTKCDWTFYIENNVYGYKVTGPNGNSIFLPTARHRYNSSLNTDCSKEGYGSYWSSSLDKDNSYGACCIYFEISCVNSIINSRNYGRSIRPVCP